MVDCSSQPKRKLSENMSYSTICPSADEMACALQTMGFQLTFQMKEFTFPESFRIPPLPAQYHFSDQYNTEVIYLAGFDAAMGKKRLPPSHASRFWIYCGANTDAFERALHTLADMWSLSWHTA